MKLSDNLFKKIESKTGVEKSTILDLASKLQDGNMKNEEALRDVIKQISSITGKNVSFVFEQWRDFIEDRVQAWNR